jgi:hypothetical protein
MVLISKWAANPIQLSATLNDSVWANTNTQKLPVAGNVWLYLRNDANSMYLAIDMPDETSNSNAASDYFWLSFDVNRNSAITANTDVNYGITPTHPGKVGKQFYISANTWTGLVSYPGDYVFAFESSPNNSTPHKVWKMRVPLLDFGINLSLLQVVAWMGLRINVSGHVYDFPANFSGAGFNTLNSSVLVFARNAVIDPALQGPVMAAVGLIPTAASIIDPATGRATTAAGYYVAVNKAAFGGMLNIIFNHNTVNTLRAAGAVKYKMSYGLVGGAMNPLSSSWSNYRWVGNDVVLDSFGADASGYYWLPNPAAQYSIEDLLMQFNSALLPNGKYQFTVQFFNNANAVVASPAQTLVLLIDNTVPVVSINSISKSTAPGVDVLTHSCDPLTLAPGEGLFLNITANDPEGDVSSIAVGYAQGDGGGGLIYSDAFDASKPVNWVGVTNLVVPTGGTPWTPAKTCVYSFSVAAYARITNGYSYIGYNSATRMLYIVKS